MEILSAGLTTLLIMDPLGNIPVFSVLNTVENESRKRKILIRELLIALICAAGIFTRWSLSLK